MERCASPDGYGALALAAAAAAFVVTNPGLHPDPVGRTMDMMAHGTAAGRSAQETFRDDALPTPTDALRVVTERTLTGDYVTFKRLWPHGVYPGLFVFGLLALIVMEIRSLWCGRPTARIVFALWLLVTTVGTVAWLPLDWDRYFLPLIPCVALLVGHGAVSLGQFAVVAVREWARARRVPAEQPGSRAGKMLALVRRWYGRYAAWVFAAVLLFAVAVLAWPRVMAWKRQMTCRAQLRRIAAALRQYREDTGDYPPWLSCLYPRYLHAKGDLICPCDASHGREGGVPPYSPGAQFPETDDTPNCAATEPVAYCGRRLPAASLRNSDVPGCSYLFEYCAARCSWWPPGWRSLYPDAAGNRDGVVSWREVKSLVEERGLGPDGRFDPARGFGGDVPIVRCFWHTTPDGWEVERMVLNVRVGDGSIYLSDGSGGGWQKEALKAGKPSARSGP